MNKNPIYIICVPRNGFVAYPISSMQDARNIRSYLMRQPFYKKYSTKVHHKSIIVWHRNDNEAQERVDFMTKGGSL